MLRKILNYIVSFFVYEYPTYRRGYRARVPLIKGM